MYNYIMLLMTAIEQERDEENNRKQKGKSAQQIAKERIGSLKALLYGIDPNEKLKQENDGMITIEVTPEDMKRAKKEKAAREKEIYDKRFGVKKEPLPSGSKTRASTRK